MIGVRRQTQIYLDGVSGRRPPIPLDADRLEAAARRRMRREAFAYVVAGAGNERTVAANRAAFDRWRIVPRMLRDVERRDTSVELFGERLPSPFLLAPVDPVFRRLIAEEPVDGPEQQPRVNLAALRTLIALARAYPASFWPTLVSGRGRAAVQRFTQIYSRPSLTWETLAFLRERTELPILLKGILHADDAARAVDEGMNGVIVSNHGGRQVDGALATLDALPAVVEAVDGRIPVLLDSGVRGGADVFKALALGARAVLIGRPYVYALAIAGRRGVRDFPLNLAADFDLTMGLAGCRSVAEIRPDAVVPAPGLEPAERSVPQ